MAIAWRRGFTQLGSFTSDRASLAKAPTNRRVRRRTLAIDFLEARCLLSAGVGVKGIHNVVSPGETHSVPVADVLSWSSPSGNQVVSEKIDWGDGSPLTDGQPGYPNSDSTIAGVHPYSHVGTYTVTTYATIHGPGHPDYISVGVGSTDVVSGLIFSNGLGPFYLHPGGSTAGDRLVGFLTDDASANSSLHATIDWGDGSGPGPATITPEPTYGIESYFGTPIDFAHHAYTVRSDHIFPTSGQYNAHVVILGPDVSKTFDVPVFVVAGPVSVSAFGDANGVAGFARQTELALVALVDRTVDPIPFTESVDWGDGSPRESLPFDASGDYMQFYVQRPTFCIINVHGTHAYAQAGDYTATVYLRYADGSESKTTTTQHIKTEAITLAGASVTATLGVSPAFRLATGTDSVVWQPFPRFFDTSNGLSANIDWGDGSDIYTDEFPLATPSPTGLLGFSLDARHDYLQAGTYQVHSTVTSASGAKAVAVSTITVRPFAALASLLQGTAGDPLSGVELAVAGLPGRDTLPTDFHASIDWGDGTAAEACTISTKTITDGSWTGSPGPRIVAVVLGSHTYRDARTYAPKLTITGPDGTPLVLTTVAKIAANPLMPAPAPRPVADPPGKTVAVAAPPPKGHFVQVYRYGHPDQVRKVWVIDSIQQAHPGHRKPGHHRIHHPVNAG